MTIEYKIGGISLADVLDQNKNVSLTDKFQFFKCLQDRQEGGDDIVDRSIERSFQRLSRSSINLIDRAARTLAAATYYS